MHDDFWKNRSVLITGHTGFKGGWLAFWLKEMGAHVHGFALGPQTEPNIFEKIGLMNKLASSVIGDVRNLPLLDSTLKSTSPEIIFHLAAQPLVNRAKSSPVETFEVNLMGAVNLMEASRTLKNLKGIVIVTTDKCYENREWVWPYRESDILGGSEPYAASKSCVEIAVKAYRETFFKEKNVQIATARAGNVIGGGDWTDGRLLPDVIRSIFHGKELVIRSPKSIRPWQHVLESVSGYLLLAKSMVLENNQMPESWNFGPKEKNFKSVEWILQFLNEKYPDLKSNYKQNSNLKEANTLKLDSSQAINLIGWKQRWDIEVSILKSLEWYEASISNKNLSQLMSKQIEEYLNS